MYRELIVRKFYPRREKSKEKKLPKQMKIYLKKVRSPSSFAISRSAYIDPLRSPCGSSFSLFFPFVHVVSLALEDDVKTFAHFYRGRTSRPTKGRQLNR